jgi:tRNA pseudouridine38-40 synthase
LTPRGATIRRVRIDLAYDGTAFAGFQHQARGRTVQATLEQALAKLAGGRPVRVRAASRTDAGVHARGQVTDCAIRSRLDDAGLARSLARLLPPDVRPLRVRTVPDSFHSQYDGLRKTYRYRIDRSTHGDALLGRFAMHVPGPLDLARLQEALGLLPGRRDWSGFADSRCRVRDRVREVYEASFFERPGGGVFQLAADGFLTRMARNLVGTVLAVASGRMPLERVAEILDRRDRTLAAAAAPARGLVLWRVTYAADDGEVEVPGADAAWGVGG